MDIHEDPLYYITAVKSGSPINIPLSLGQESESGRYWGGRQTIVLTPVYSHKQVISSQKNNVNQFM